MAEELVFEINTDSVAKSLADLAASTERLKQANKELAKEAAAGNKEAAVAIERNNAVIKVQQAEYRTLQNNLKGYLGAKKQEVDLVNFGNNSIKANRELLKQLTAQYIGLKNPSQEATNQIKRLSDTLKQQEAAIGDTRRNVGNYAEGIKEALGDLNLFGVKVGNVTGAISGMGDAFKGAGGGINGISAGLSSLGGLTLPLVAGAVGLLSKAFEAYAPLADAVEQQTAGITAAFSALVSGRSISDAYTATVEFTEALQDLQDTQESFNRSQIDYNNEVQRAILTSKDASKSLYDRILALNEAERAEKAAFNEAKSRNDEQIKLFENVFIKRAALSEKELFLFKEGDDADKKLVRDRLERSGILGKDIEDYLKLLTKRTQIEGDNLNVLEKIQNRRNAFIEKEQQEQAKAAEEAQKLREKQIEEQRKYWEQIDALRDEFLLSDREKLAKSFDDKLADIKGNSAKEIELRLAIEQEKQFALDKFDADAEEKRQQRLGERLKKEIDDRKAAQEQLRQNAQLQTDLENLLFDENVDRQTRQAEIDRQFAESGFATFKEFYDARKKVYEEDAREKLKADALKQQSEKATISAVQSSADSIIGLIGQVADAQGAGAEFQKALAFTQVLIQQALAIANAVVGATSAGSQTGIAAVATTPAFIATLVGAVTSIFGSIIGIFSEAETPKFATGVIGLNGPGTETSDSIPAYLSKGESVMTAKATKVFAPMLAQMEMAVGNKPNWDFSSGHFANGVIGTYGDGGSYVRDVAKGVTDQLTNASMRQLLRELPQPVVAVTDFKKVEKSYNKSVAVKEG